GAAAPRQVAAVLTRPPRPALQPFDPHGEARHLCVGLVHRKELRRGKLPRVCERLVLDSPCRPRLETGRSDVTGRVTARLAGVEANRPTRPFRPGSGGYPPPPDGRRGS